MKAFQLFTPLMLLVSSGNIMAADVNEFIQSQRSQWENITTSVIQYETVKTIPPVSALGSEALEQKQAYIDKQKELFAVYKDSENYSPEEGEKVLHTIQKLEKSLDEPLVIHQEVTFITAPNKRLVRIQRLSEGTPALQTRVFNDGDSFLHVADSGMIRNDRNSKKWLNPVLGLCRFGSDLGWWLDNGFSIAAYEDRFALLDPDHQIAATFTPLSDGNLRAWREMELFDGYYKIIADNFQDRDGLPVPATVVVQKRVDGGDYVDTEWMTLVNAEVNTAVDAALFERPAQTAE